MTVINQLSQLSVDLKVWEISSFDICYPKLYSGFNKLGLIILAFLLFEICANWALIGQLLLIGWTWKLFRIFLTLSWTKPTTWKKNFSNRPSSLATLSCTHTHTQTDILTLLVWLLKCNSSLLRICGDHYIFLIIGAITF